MSQSEHIVEALKRALKSQQMTYADLAQRLEMSEAGVKKAFAEQNFSLQRLEEICNILKMSITDLVRLSAQNLWHSAAPLTHDQETHLANDDRLFAVYVLAHRGLKFSDILKHFRFTDAELNKLLIHLDKLGLIAFGAKQSIKCLQSLDTEWLPDGPLRQRYDEDVRREFLLSSFDGPDKFLKFLSGSLTDASLGVLKRKVEKLAREFRELAQLDEMVREEKTHRVWFLSCYRPWTFSVIEKLRRSTK